MNPRNLLKMTGDIAPVAVEPMEGGVLAWTSVVIMATAALLIIAAYAGAKEKLRPNPFFGIRTNLTSGDDEAWYAVHRKAAAWLAVSGFAMAAGGASLFLVKDGQTQLVLLLAALAVCVTMVIAGGLTSSWSVRNEWSRREGASGSGASSREGE